MAKYTIELEVFTYDELLWLTKEDMEQLEFKIERTEVLPRPMIRLSTWGGDSLKVAKDECLIVLPCGRISVGEIDDSGLLICYESDMINYVYANKVRLRK